MLEQNKYNTGVWLRLLLSVPKTPSSWQSWSGILPQVKLKTFSRHETKLAALCLRLERLEALRAAKQELKVCRTGGERKSLGQLRKRVGARGTMKTLKANDLVDSKLELLNSDLGKHFGETDVILFRSPLAEKIDDKIRDYIEEVKRGNPDNKKLCVLIQTLGGYVEVVERIYQVFRKHYQEIIFIVPNYAYSAGTVLVLSGDEIYMDSYSVLGPIDPQFQADDGSSWYSGIGYLQKFNELVKTINEDTKAGKTVTAQLSYLRKFDPMKLFQIEQARDHSKELLTEWLPKHKFKNWVKTDGGKPVTAQYKKDRAGAIADILAKPERWHSHGRGIGIKQLRDEEIRLKIHNFEEDPTLNALVREYYELFIDYCDKLPIENAVHSNCGLRSL
jgi:Serine dehydrogenase proteinase